MGDRNFSRLWLACVLISLVGSCCLGYIGNSYVGREMSTLTDGLQDTVDVSSETVNSMVDLIKGDETNFNVDVMEIETLQSELGVVNKLSLTAKGNVHKAEQWRFHTLNLSMLVVIGLVLIGLVGSLCNLSYLAFWMCIVAWIAAVLAWLCFGVHLGVSVFLDDTCYKFDEYLMSDNRNVDGLDHMIKCPDSEVFKGSFDNAYNAIESMRQQVNKQDSGLPSLEVDTISKKTYVNPEAVNSYDQHEAATTAFDTRCNTTQTTLQYKSDNEALWMQSNKTKASNLKHIIGRMKNGSKLGLKISYISTCELFRFFVKKMFDGACGHMMTGFFYVYICYGAIGVLMLATVVIASKIANRLDSDNWEENIASADEKESSDQQKQGLLQDVEVQNADAEKSAAEEAAGQDANEQAAEVEQNPIPESQTAPDTLEPSPDAESQEPEPRA